MTIFDSYIKDELKLKVDSFRSGKRDFSVQELNDIKLFLLRFKDTLINTAFFKGEIKGNKVISCFAESYYDELFDHIIHKLSADIAIIVVLSHKKVIFKKNDKTCKINLCNLAKIISDGECENYTESIACGNITKTFLNLTKTLAPC